MTLAPDHIVFVVYLNFRECQASHYSATTDHEERVDTI